MASPGAPDFLSPDQLPPEVVRRSAVGVDVFLAGARYGCAHVVDGTAGPTACLCVLHPRLGVRCVACMGEHTIRHEAPAHDCAVCGGSFAELHPVAPMSEANLEVRSPNGQTGTFVGMLWRVGLGVCPDCLTAAMSPW